MRKYFKKATLKFTPTTSKKLAKGSVYVTKKKTVITKFKK
jgi:hypothetical protein